MQFVRGCVTIKEPSKGDSDQQIRQDEELDFEQNIYVNDSE